MLDLFEVPTIAPMTAPAATAGAAAAADAGRQVEAVMVGLDAAQGAAADAAGGSS